MAGIFDNEIYRIRQRIGDLIATDGSDITIDNARLKDGEFPVSFYEDVWNTSAKEIFKTIISTVDRKELHHYIPGFLNSTALSVASDDTVDISSITGNDYRILSISSGSEIYREVSYDELAKISKFRIGKFYAVLGNKVYFSERPSTASVLVYYAKYEDNSPAYFSPVVRDKIVELAVLKLIQARNINNPAVFQQSGGNL